MIWFTADTHFTHTNILKYCNRPFESIEEHDEILIQNWNRVVKPKEMVYHLGDVGFSFKAKNPYRLITILQKLHGKIFLIRGNHDGQAMISADRFVSVKDVHTLKHQKQKLFLSHYSHRTWPGAYRGVPHLYGHSHGNLPDYGLSFDVGVDNWNYTPISFDQVMEKIETLEHLPV